MDTPALAINKVCLSGLQALHLADLLVRSGDADVVVAGGMESMSHAPHLVRGLRSGVRYGSTEVEDSIVVDGFTCAFSNVVMGEASDADAEREVIGREAQDRLALESHRRAAAGADRLAEEIVPIPGTGRSPTPVTADEGVHAEATLDRLAALPAAFRERGTITAGNASQISDGAAALVIASPEAAEALGCAPLAEIVGYGQVAGPDASLLHQPARAIRAACEASGTGLGDVDLFEINEAFAAVALASRQDLGIPEDLVNVNGGAIALGHPIGMSGARLALTLTYELRRRGGGLGAAALCGGGGQGDAILLRVCPA